LIEEPTAPDDISGHAQIRKGLKPHGIGVATGEHACVLPLLERGCGSTHC
jgi:L-alanine-DL-glutamate epimerase-like enolase superfamily enzyme